MQTGGKMKKIYISGPITGIKNYRKNFARAEKLLKKKGYDVVNPVTIGDAIQFGENTTVRDQYCEYMKQDIVALIGCDSLYLLSGWESSTGAELEVRVAQVCGIEIIMEGEA